MARDNDEDDLQEQVEKLADRLKLKGTKRQKYIHDHMLQGGYRAEPKYVRDSEDEEDSGGIFGRRRKSRDDDDDGPGFF